MLLVQATASRLADLARREEFLMLEGTQTSAIHPHRAPTALAILAAFVVLVTTGALPIVTLALLAGAAMVVTRVLSPRTVYREIDWQVLVLIAGTLALGRALDASGAARFLAEGLVGVVGVLGPVGVISAIYLVTNLLTEAMSNSATAVLMAPIAISTAGALGIDPRPLVFAVAFAASASFATPIGYQTNTFVYGPGGYRFLDYVRVGLPLNLLFWATATFLIPVLYG
jgi:di/tricarboxylate transporter